MDMCLVPFKVPKMLGYSFLCGKKTGSCDLFVLQDFSLGSSA